MQKNIGSDSTTEGIRIQVFPDYLPEQSAPDQKQFFFSYRVLITNQGEKWAKLLSRHWIIINADGDRQDVEGPGVVGHVPELNSGESFEYTASCPLDTNWGTMEGYYVFMRNDGTKFKVNIERFYLISDEVTA
jgi:ApaG protein